MKAIEEMLYDIRLQIELYRSKNYNSNKLGIVISSENLERLIEDTRNSTNIKLPEKVSDIKLFGCNVFPSDFINNDSIIVSEILPL